MRPLHSLVASLRSGDWVTPERIRGYSVLFLVLTALGTGALWTTGHGLLDRLERPIGTDFANPYAAGRMALQGRAAAVYDYRAHFAEQRAIFNGGEDHPFYGWHYPPIFLLLAAPLALLPYLPALLLWLGATFALYLAAVRAILPNRLALLAAAAFPGVFINVGHGQNAFLTAGLLGLGLAHLAKRPWVAGLLLGALAYKPHFGLVIPLVLIAGGHWKAFVGAAASAITLCGLSLAVFGPEPWRAFLQSGTLTRTAVLEQVSTGWYKIQSLFSAVRGMGGSVEAAYFAQAALSLCVALSLGWLWFRGGGREAKAAVAVGALLVTPYVLDYDLMLLAPALAFLTAAGLRSGFRPYEKTLLAFVWASPLFARAAAHAFGLPIGLLSMLALFAAACTGAARSAGTRSDTSKRFESPTEDPVAGWAGMDSSRESQGGVPDSVQAPQAIARIS